MLNALPHPVIKVNYDSGNSASLGYSVTEEFAAYGNRIGSIHIKDRLPERWDCSPRIRRGRISRIVQSSQAN